MTAPSGAQRVTARGSDRLEKGEGIQARGPLQSEPGTFSALARGHIGDTARPSREAARAPVCRTTKESRVNSDSPILMLAVDDANVVALSRQ